MSVQAITWALSFAVKSPTEKAVLLVLANYADGDGVCFPGQENIAAQAACTDRTVRAVLAAFEERGVIARAHRQRRDGSRTSDEIKLVAFASPATAQPEKSSARPTGNLRRSNRKSTPILPEQISGLTTFEPSEEPSEEPCLAVPVARRAPTRAEVALVWSSSPRLARQRSSQNEVSKALEASMRRGHSVEAILAGLSAAYASRTYSGDHAKGLHLLIQNDRWQSFIETESAATDWDDDRWRAALALNREEGLWSAKLGPKPGDPGCRVPAALLTERRAA